MSQTTAAQDQSKVHLRYRQDGRWEVSVDGYVRWCGKDEKTARVMAAVLEKAPARHPSRRLGSFPRLTGFVNW